MVEGCKFFDREKIGDLMSRLDNDTERVAEPVGESAKSIAMGLLSIAASLGFCFYTNRELTVISMAVLLPIALARVWYASYAFKVVT
jgi:ABC-type multidrug transport system fused ATPase/permease subunit